MSLTAPKGEGLSFDFPPDTLVGLYDEFDPELPGPAPLNLGVLLIEPPCIYVEQQVSSFDAEEPTTQHTERYLVRLPRALARFDHTSDSLWVGQNGPMTTGDKIEFGGVARPSPIGSQFYYVSCYAQGTYHSDWMSPAGT